MFPVNFEVGNSPERQLYRGPGKISQAIGKIHVVELSFCRESCSVHQTAPSMELVDQREKSCHNLCPLSQMRTGVSLRIKQLCASPELQNRLRELGLGEEQIIRLITSQTNFICQVCNVRLAISAQLAQLILVEPIRV
jgi:Fe2+ transport system protein FeoA